MLQSAVGVASWVLVSVGTLVVVAMAVEMSTGMLVVAGTEAEVGASMMTGVSLVLESTALGA